MHSSIRAVRGSCTTVRTGAFTLLEMLLTLALIALLAGALIGGSSALLSEKPQSADDVFWSTVRAARKSALTTQNDLNLRFDERAKAFVLTGTDGAGQTFPVPNPPSDLVVDFLPAQATGGSVLLGGTVVEKEPLPGGVTFYSDGTCTAFRAQIRVAGGAHIVAIDPWTCSPVITPVKTP
jgi:general secretion pathway protein H